MTPTARAIVAMSYSPLACLALAVTSCAGVQRWVDAGATWPDNLRHVLRPEDDGWHVDLGNLQGDLIRRDSAIHDDQLHALLCAEQRYLVEEVGAGSVPGETYRDMAEERIRGWRENA